MYGTCSPVTLITLLCISALHSRPMSNSAPRWEDEDVIGIDSASMGEDVKRLQNAEPPLILQGLSHFLWFEEHDGKRGHDQATAAIDKFHQKHA